MVALAVLLTPPLFLQYFHGVWCEQVRGLAHPSHWKGPLGGLFESFGAVKASPRSAYRLLKAGEAVLLFPGGGREVSPAQQTNEKNSKIFQLCTARVAAFCSTCKYAALRLRNHIEHCISCR